MSTHTSIVHLLPVHPPHLPMKSQTYALILLPMLCITYNSSNLTTLQTLQAQARPTMLLASV